MAVGMLPRLKTNFLIQEVRHLSGLNGILKAWGFPGEILATESVLDD